MTMIMIVVMIMMMMIMMVVVVVMMMMMTIFDCSILMVMMIGDELIEIIKSRKLPTVLITHQPCSYSHV